VIAQSVDGAQRAASEGEPATKVNEASPPLTLRGAKGKKASDFPEKLEMSNHASAEKRNRQRITRTARNRTVTSRVRTLVKRVRTAIEAKDKTTATTALKVAIVALDKATTKGVVHPKSSSRTVSRLSAQVHKL